MSSKAEERRKRKEMLEKYKEADAKVSKEEKKTKKDEGEMRELYLRSARSLIIH